MAHLYPADYTTLTEARTIKGIDAVQTGDDDMLIGFIHQASDFIDTWTTRHFVPYVQTKSFDSSYVSNGYDLYLRDDLLSVTTLTNGDSSVISGAGYNLRPDNVYPKHTVELVSSSAATWLYNYRESRVTIAGIWGYHDNYARAWLNRSTLSASLTDSATSMTVANLPYFSALDYVMIDSEQIQITDIDAGQATITRGVNGTTAAAHNSAAIVSLYQQTPVIRFCANQIVKWLYERRDRAEGAIQLAGELGVVIVQELPEVKKLLDRFIPLVSRIGAV